MHTSLNSDLHIKRQPGRQLMRGILVGAGAGLVGTIVMDLFGLVVLLVAGGPDTISFSLIGDAAATFFSSMGIEVPGGTPLGVLLHYVIGVALGLAFGAGICIVGVRDLGLKKGVVLGVLFVEAMSIPMLTAAAIVLQMTLSHAALYFATSFTMHLVFGSVVGLVVSYGLRSPHAAKIVAGRIAGD